jgi:hypothetical protein
MALLAALAVLGLPGVLRAGEPTWSPAWEAGLTEAKERNCPMLLLAPFKRGTLAPCVFPKVFNDPEVVKMCEQFVCFLADDQRFKEIDTIYAAKYVKPDSGKYGALQVIFCKSDGTELEKLRLVSDAPKSKLIDNMKIALKDYADIIPKSEYDSANALRQRAELMRSLGHYANAIDDYKELAKKTTKLKFVGEAKNKPEELEKEAAEKVEEAGGHLSGVLQGEKKEGLNRLEVYYIGMKGLKAYAKVKEYLVEAKKDKDLREQHSAARKNAKAFEQFVKGEVAYLEGKYKDAAKLYKKITDSYEETGYYDKAKERLTEIMDKLNPKKTTP